MNFKSVIVNGKQRIIVTKIATGTDKTSEAANYVMREYEPKNSSQTKISV